MLFGENTISSIAPSSKLAIEADMSYDHITGLELLRLEQYQEEYNLFIEMCKSDAKEIQMLSENVEEEQIAYHEEVSLKSIQEQLLKLFDRIVAAIQGAYKNFIQVFGRMLGRVGKDFLKKHHDEIYNKDISGLKFAYQKPIKGSLLDMGVTKLDSEFFKSLLSGDFNASEAVEEDDEEDKYLGKSKPKEFYTLYILKALCNKDDIPADDIVNSFSKYFHDQNFEKEDKEYSASESELDTYFKFIDYKFLDDVKENLKDQMSTFSNIRSVIKTGSFWAEKLVRLLSGKDSKASDMTASARKRGLIALEGIQEALTIYNKAFLSDAKFAIEQSNKIMMAIYKYKSDES